MNTNENFLKDLQNANIIWTEAKHGHAMYEAVYNGEPVRLRLNDFPDEVAFTLFVRGEEIDIEEFPPGWHFAPEE